MANRRMFSLKIIDTDLFLDMPTSSRLLYFDLSMRADDDGFVSSPKKIIKMTGASEDDLKILIVKKFLIPFENGVCVIKHWKIHNYIQKDRYSPTLYFEEKKELKTNKDNSYQVDTQCIQDVSKMDTQVRLGKVRKGKVRLGKVKEEETKKKKFSSINDLKDFDLKEIAEKLGTPIKFVESKYEDMQLYCGSRGKKYKNYKMALQAWCKKDAIKIKQDQIIKGVKIGKI